MEQFVKRLYDRLEGQKDLQLQLWIIMQNAINEMHNSGIIAGLTGAAAQAVHDPDPEVRIREKTAIAKTVAKQLIPTTLPVPSGGKLSYLANLNYDPRFVNSITLCFQGGIEGLHMSIGAEKLDKYIIQVNAKGHDLAPLKKNIELLDKMYPGISLILMSDGSLLYGQEQKSEPPVQEKKGFFARLFGK